MKYYTLKLCGLTRKLPIVSLGPKLKIASFNLLGDGELVEAVAKDLAKELKKYEFDYLVGPEVKVVPLLQALAKKTKEPRYVILRKNIMGYMTKPMTNKSKPSLVLNGPDAKLLKGKKVVMVDDVISTGRTIRVARELLKMAGAEVVGMVAVLKQGEKEKEIDVPFSFLGILPLFGT
ncbi:adenine phosphoribosyltransferase [Candidatus Saccharibacteria bacterium]|nr:adenine phosphoribosyltransferase [Candidatus Saccharibacteria bacterium]